MQNQKMKILTICLLAISSIGCQPALINMPDCPKIKPPPPVADNLIIELKDGRVIRIDDSGEALIRDYVMIRKALK